MDSFKNLSLNDTKNDHKLSSPLIPSFIGSDVILLSIFDAIDQNVFNCNLDGTKLEWCDSLKSRAAVSYQQHTYSIRQTYVRCSKAWIKKCTRKQFMEIVLYEMLDLFINMKASTNSDNLKVYLLECAIQYLNRRFGTSLSINNNYSKNDGDTSDVKKILDTIASERKKSNKRALIEGFKVTPVMQMLTKKLNGNSREYKCNNNCMICYCEPQMIFRKRYYGVNIFAIYAVPENEAKCLLCEKEMTPNTMDAHLDNDCHVFIPLPKPTAYQI